MIQTITLSEYIFTRLYQLGIRGIHGVPGDYNLIALDYVEKSGLTWVGNCNELNAGYAADGYARVKGIGALVTTYGVGELSAMNAHAGAFAEFVSLVHIVGTPPTYAQKEGRLVHHSLGNGDFHVFERMFNEISVASTSLFDRETAPAEVDRVLKACFIETRPVYIQLPGDMAAAQVDARPLDQRLDVCTRSKNEEAEDTLVSLILQKLYSAAKPIILVDAGAHRHRSLDETDTLVRGSGLPTFVAPMGKGTVNESLPNYMAVYAGSGSHPKIQEMVDSTDLALTIGNVKSDINTAGFTYRISELNSIDIHSKETNFNHATFQVHMAQVLSKLTAAIEPSRLRASGRNRPRPDLGPIDDCAIGPGCNLVPANALTHAWFWRRISTWLRPGDIVVTETGTPFVGIWDTILPPQSTTIMQALWSSVGYAIGAAQGAALAAKELGHNQRTVLFQGDGGFQLSGQELATIIKLDLRVTIFLIENNGYTIERWVHGMDAGYNDIPQWRYADFPRVVTPEARERDGSAKVKTYKVATRAEVDALLDDKEFNTSSGLNFVELHMPQYDGPKLFESLNKVRGEA